MHRRVWLTIFIALAAGTAFAYDEIDTKFDEQEQRIKMLERRLELQEEASSASSHSGVKANSNGFVIQSTDDRNTIRFRGVVQLDGRWFSGGIDTTNSDTWLLRRVRPTFEGTVNGIYDF